MQKILVVDDDPVVRTLVTEYLRHHGHRVEVLASGRLCLDKLKTEAPDVLVLDMLMPDMNGQEVLQNLRSNPSTANIPVIMLSADKHMAGEAGESAKADWYLQKPFDIKEFLAAIEALQGHARD